MAKTDELPIEGEGVSTKKIKALDVAIDDWRDAVEKRMALTKKEVEAGAKVRDLMHKHNVTAYPYTDSGDVEKLVILEGKENLKLKKAEDADEGEDDGEN